MARIEWKDFEKVELRIGIIVEVKGFPEAREPAFRYPLAQAMSNFLQRETGLCTIKWV